MTNGLDGPGRDAIALRIVALQKALKIKVNEVFAAKCGISPQAMSNYKRKGGYRRPNIDQAGKIAAGTGVSVDWLLYGERKDQLPYDIRVGIYGKD